MVKLVNTSDLKSDTHNEFVGSIPTADTSFRKVLYMQTNHRRLWHALGTVTGFHGYLNHLNQVVKSTDIDAISKYFLEIKIQTLAVQLEVIEEVIRKRFKSMKIAKKRNI